MYKTTIMMMVLGFSSVLVACGVDTTEEVCEAGTCGAAGSAGASGASGEAGAAGTSGSAGASGADSGVGCTPGEKIIGKCCPTNADAYQTCKDDHTYGECVGCGGAGGAAGAGGSAGTGGSPMICVPGLIESCTAGCPAGQTGKRTCAQDGMSWSACGNCQGGPQQYVDNDKDGYGNPASPVTTGGVTNASDCDDTNASVTTSGSRSCTGASNCAGTQTCSNGVWGVCTCSQQYTHYRDADGDGHGTNSTSITDQVTDSNVNAPAGYSNSHDDCIDSDSTIYPGATELCDGKDNNCDGVVDEGCGVQDGGNPMSTVTIDYTAAGDPDISWAVPVIEGAWDGRNYAAFTGCTQSGLTAHCTFQMETGLVESLKVETALGNGKYWGDFSGAFPSECKAPTEAAALSGSSMTILGTLSIKVDGSPKVFHLCPNGDQKLPSCTGCCSASGPFPYYNAVLKPTC